MQGHLWQENIEPAKHKACYYEKTLAASCDTLFDISDQKQSTLVAAPTVHHTVVSAVAESGPSVAKFFLVPTLRLSRLGRAI